MLTVFLPTAIPDEGTPVKKSQGIVSVHIADVPDLTMRAVLLDLNPYGRVPTMVNFVSHFFWGKRAS